MKKMFGFFKNLFGNHESNLPTVTNSAASTVARPVAAASPTATPFTRKPPLTPLNAHTNSNGNGNGNGKKANGQGVQLLLQPILDNLPVELRRKALHSDLGGASVNLPVEKILPQLSRGVIKITFGELRTAAPGVFQPATDRDQVEIVLPLAQILGQINPALLARRPEQNQVEVPDDVSSPFGGNGAGLIFSIGQGKSQPVPLSPVPAPSTPPIRSITPTSAPLPPTPTPPPARSITPEPLKPAPTLPNRNNFISVAPPLPPAVTPPAAPPVIPQAPVLRMATPPATNSLPTPPPKLPTPAPAVVPVVPAAPVSPGPVLPQTAEPAAAGEVLIVPLASLAARWPETVRSDIVRLNLMAGKLHLPVSLIEPALKHGRVPFKWGLLRSWVKPAPMLNMSPHDEVVVELPLDIIAPMFVERQRAKGKGRTRVAIDESIPDLFFGFPQPDSPSGSESHAVTRPADTNFLNKNPETAHLDIEQVTTEPAPKPADTNFYVWSDSSDTVHLDKVDTVPAKMDTEFIRRTATPNEIVTRAAALENVAGALVALPDGLMVAGKIPSDLNGDTLAGFVPQIFNKVNQASNELRMGELNNLAFTVGNVPWKIFRVNAVFFAAFGRAGEQMPSAQLAGLANELDQKNR